MYSTGLQKQRGMTLVELMIAGVISIIVGLVVMQLMIGSNRASNRLDGLSQAQENARFSMSWLTDQIRHAGYVGDIFFETAPGIAERCTENFVPPASNADCVYEDLAGTRSGDRIAIRRFYVDNGGTDWSQQSCSGAAIPAGIDEEYLVDVFWVEADADAEGNLNIGDDYDDWLRCATYRESTGTIIGTVQTIASGIESMQVLYTAPGAGNSATQYVGADTLAPASVTTAQSGETAPTNSDIEYLPDVTAVRIAILARAFSDAAQVTGDRSYVLLDADPLVFDDRVPRQILETTIFLPNRPLSGSL